MERARYAPLSVIVRCQEERRPVPLDHYVSQVHLKNYGTRTIPWFTQEIHPTVLSANGT